MIPLVASLFLAFGSPSPSPASPETAGAAHSPAPSHPAASGAEASRAKRASTRSSPKRRGAKPRKAPVAPERVPDPAPPVELAEPVPAPAPPPVLPLPMASGSEVQAFEQDDALAGPTAAEDVAVPPGEVENLPGDRPREAARLDEDGEQVGVIVRTATPEPAPPRLMFRRRPNPPEKTAAFVLGYRLFTIRDPLLRRQAWHVVSVEVTPLRRYFRLNLITEFGWEGGEAAKNGDLADMMLLGKVGVGVQYPMWVTPFVEFQGGAGGVRLEVFERNDMIFMYTLGLDVGAQWAVTRWMFLHTAIGWIRPVFQMPEGDPVRYDRFTFKMGVGF